MTVLFILNDPPYGSERGFNAVRLGARPHCVKNALGAMFGSYSTADIPLIVAETMYDFD